MIERKNLREHNSEKKSSADWKLALL